MGNQRRKKGSKGHQAFRVKLPEGCLYVDCMLKRDGNLPKAKTVENPTKNDPLGKAHIKFCPMCMEVLDWDPIESPIAKSTTTKKKSTKTAKESSSKAVKEFILKI